MEHGNLKTFNVKIRVNNGNFEHDFFTNNESKSIEDLFSHPLCSAPEENVIG